VCFLGYFSIIVAFWAFSILDFWLSFGWVSYEGTNVFFSKYWPSKSGCVLSAGASYTRGNTMWVASPWGFSEMTIQPARHECHTCCPLQAEKPWIQPLVGHTHGTHVEQVVSSFQKIHTGSQLTWYGKLLKRKNTQVRVHIFFRSCKQLLIYFEKLFFFLSVSGAGAWKNGLTLVKIHFRNVYLFLGIDFLPWTFRSDQRFPKMGASFFFGTVLNSCLPKKVIKLSKRAQQ